MENAEEVLTHGGPDRCYRICRCSRCGLTDMCTPTFDFYTYKNDDTGPLYCGSCLQIRYWEEKQPKN